MRIPPQLTLSPQLKPWLIVMAAIVAAFALPALLGYPYWLPLGIALAAFGLALYAVYRTQLLEFAPEVLAGDVILPRLSRAASGVKFLLPLQFSNAGGADGIVHWIALRLTIDGDLRRSTVLSPVAEIDMQRFIQAKRRLHEDNTIDPFVSFPLEAKKSAAKFVVFEAADHRSGDPLQLRPGRYAFELFLKASGMRGPKLMRAFEHQLEQKHVDDYAADATVYLINYQITLPGVRRELAGLEWLPRGSS
jgi:hypothetical protein